MCVGPGESARQEQARLPQRGGGKEDLTSARVQYVATIRSRPSRSLSHRIRAGFSHCGIQHYSPANISVNTPLISTCTPFFHSKQGG